MKIYYILFFTNTCRYVNQRKVLGVFVSFFNFALFLAHFELRLAMSLVKFLQCRNVWIRNTTEFGRIETLLQPTWDTNANRLTQTVTPKKKCPIANSEDSNRTQNHNRNFRRCATRDKWELLSGALLKPRNSHSYSTQMSRLNYSDQIFENSCVN